MQGRARHDDGDLELNRRPTIVREPAFSTSRGERTWAVPHVDWLSCSAGLEALVAPRGSHQSSATVVAFLSRYLRRRTEKSRGSPIWLSHSFSIPLLFLRWTALPMYSSARERTLSFRDPLRLHTFSRQRYPFCCDAFYSTLIRLDTVCYRSDESPVFLDLFNDVCLL